MKFTTIDISNYKSLRNVSAHLGDLSVFVGANASGKTNLTEALDFLGEVYKLGLEGAVARKGGYENIAFRRARRARAPIRFRAEVEVPYTFKFQHRRQLSDRRQEKLSRNLVLTHEFEFKAKTTAIDAPFTITHEEISAELVEVKRPERRDFLISLSRTKAHAVKKVLTSSRRLRKYIDYGPLSQFRGSTDYFNYLRGRKRADLFFADNMLYYTHSFGFGVRQQGLIKSFQLNPRACREVGIPTPNPELTRFGGNLPAMIPFLKRTQPSAYARLVPLLGEIFPGLEDLKYNYTHTKALALFFKERGFKRPWNAEDVSDGTIQTLAMLVAIFDPRNSVVVIEEPENSMHPWGIRSILKAIKLESKNKQIILTSHSPIVVDNVHPSEVSVVSRDVSGHSKITPLLKLNPTVRAQWEQGTASLSKILDSGLISESVPSA